VCEHVSGIDHLRAGQASNVRFHDWNDLIACEAASVQACAAAAADFTRQALPASSTPSGTGGAPRGVMQHHGAILHNVEGCIDVIANDFSWDDEVFLSFLAREPTPMSIAAGRCSRSGLGAEIYYSEGTGEARLEHRGGAADA
jgi:long-chain acyl-CoA synthetase